MTDDNNGDGGVSVKFDGIVEWISNASNDVDEWPYEQYDMALNAILNPEGEFSLEYRPILTKLAEIINNAHTIQDLQSVIAFLPAILIRYTNEEFNPELDSLTMAHYFLVSISKTCFNFAKSLDKDNHFAKPGSQTIFSSLDSSVVLKGDIEYVIPQSTISLIDKNSLEFDNQGEFISLFLYLINETSLHFKKNQKIVLDLIELICTAGYDQHGQGHLLRIKFTEQLYLEILSTLIRVSKTEFSTKALKCLHLMNQIARATFNTFGLLITRIGHKILQHITACSSENEADEVSFLKPKVSVDGSTMNDLKKNLTHERDDLKRIMSTIPDAEISEIDS